MNDRSTSIRQVVAPTVTDDDPSLSGADWTAAGVFRVAEGVYRIPLPLPNDGLRAVNVYAVADERGGDPGWTLVDAGWALEESRALLDRAMRALGSDLREVRRFLVTHSHRDHYTQAITIRREFGAEVLIGAGERVNLERVIDPDHAESQNSVPRLRRAGAKELAAAIERAGRGHVRDMNGWLLPDGYLEDRSKVVVGESRTLEVIETPGHTRGHVVFADEADDLLFAGDHVLPRITPSIGLEPVPTPSPLSAFLASLQLIRERPDAALLPAHGPVGRRVHERVDELLAHHGARLDASLAAVREGRHTPFLVAQSLPWTRRNHALADLDRWNAMLAILETQHHLEVLVERGALTRTEQEGVLHYALA